MTGWNGKMAERKNRQNYSSACLRSSLLRQYILKGVVPTDKTLGTGSYGLVLEVMSVARRIEVFIIWK